MQIEHDAGRIAGAVVESTADLAVAHAYSGAILNVLWYELRHDVAMRVPACVPIEAETRRLVANGQAQEAHRLVGESLEMRIKKGDFGPQESRIRGRLSPALAQLMIAGAMLRRLSRGIDARIVEQGMPTVWRIAGQGIDPASFESAVSQAGEQVTDWTDQHLRDAYWELCAAVGEYQAQPGAGVPG